MSDTVLANPFDQFGAAPPSAADTPAQNPFDQFDGHPVAGPSGDLGTDIKRRLGTAGIDAVAGLASAPRSVAHGIDWLTGKVGIPPLAEPALTSIPGPTEGKPFFPDAQTVRDGLFKATGATEYQPATTGGRIGQAAMAGGLMALVNPMAAARTALPMAASGAGAQTASELTEPGSFAHDIAPVVGGLAGGALGAGVSNVASSGSRVMPVAGGSLDAGTAQLANVARQEGIPLTVGQVSNSYPVKALAAVSGKMPFSGGAEFAGQQQTAFNSAVARSFGEDAPKITPEVLQNARDRIGGVMNDVANRTTIRFDPQFGNDLSNVVRNATGELTEGQIAPIRMQLQNVLGKVQPGGTITGDAYQALTRFDTPLGRAMRAPDVGVRYYAGQIRDALDGALQRSAAPEDVMALAQARAQWKNMRTIEPLTLRADTPGAATPSTGDISPAALRGAVNQAFPRAATAPLGDVPLNDLAKVGQRFLKEPGSSNTAENATLSHLMTGGVAGLFGGGGELHGGHVAAAASALASLGVGRAVNAGLRNQWLANRSIDASLNPNGFRFQAPGFTPLMPLMGSMQPQLPSPQAP